MEETQFPYHKVIQEKLVKSTLIPVALLGMALIVITPFLLIFLLWQQVNHEAYLASQAVSVPLKEYIEGMKQLQSDPKLISFLTSGEHSIEAYERLYQFRNEQSVFAYFQLENEQYSAAQMPPSSANRLLPSIRAEVSRSSEIVGSTSTVTGLFTDPILFTLSCRMGEEGLGTLSFHFTEGSLKALLQQGGVHSMLLNASGRLLVSTDPMFAVYERLEDQPIVGQLSRINGEIMLIQKTPLSVLGLSVWTVHSLDIVISMMAAELVIGFLIFLFCAYFIDKISRMTARSSLKNVDNLFLSLQSYAQSGRLEYLPEEENEMRPIAQHYNRILDEVKQLIDQNGELQKQTRIAQIRQLQSQFNPHFIFNTLDTIKYMIVLDQDKAEDMIVRLSKLLRYSLDASEESLVDLDQDLAYIEDYLQLQKVRLGETFRYQIEAPKHSGLRIPKMVIQPMVENSLAHGFVQDREFRLLIKIRQEGEILQVIVQDNGEGMDQAQLNQIRSDLKTMREDYRHIGIMNSHKRILLHFGEGCGVQVESVLHEGTTITLTMKAMGGMSDDSDSNCGR